MSDRVEWESDLSLAMSMARVQEKPILLEFYNPGCGACQQLEAVTYHDHRIVEFIKKYMIPVRVNTSAAPQWAGKFVVQHTPTVLILDAAGKEQSRSVGFLPPEEFGPALMLGIAKAHFQAKREAQARAMLDWLLMAYPMSQAAHTARTLKARA